MSIYVAIVDDMKNATDGDLMAIESDLFSQAGVKDTSSHFSVTEKSTPDMSVDVSTGIAYVENDSHTEFSSDTKFWRVLMDASDNVSISSNASGSTRVDLVCIKFDTGASPDANASNVASIFIVEGTPGSGAPATPSNHLKLDEVSVADGATSITNANITDSRQEARFSQKLFGNDIGAGWFDADESWSYSSWDADTRIGEITVPTDAITKYSVGMRIRISQSTGGTKYGIIHKVTSTTLTVFIESGATLANEAISSPYYSTQKAPFGFPMDKGAWKITKVVDEDNSQSSPDDQWYNLGGSITVGPGAWDLRYKSRTLHTGRGAISDMASSNNSGDEVDSEASDYSSTDSDDGVKGRLSTGQLSNETTYYVNFLRATSSTTLLRSIWQVITAESAYL